MRPKIDVIDTIYSDGDIHMMLFMIAFWFKTDKRTSSSKD